MHLIKFETRAFSRNDESKLEIVFGSYIARIHLGWSGGGRRNHGLLSFPFLYYSMQPATIFVNVENYLSLS